jgi:hypothetical protein
MFHPLGLGYCRYKRSPLNEEASNYGQARSGARVNATQGFAKAILKLQCKIHSKMEEWNQNRTQAGRITPLRIHVMMNTRGVAEAAGRTVPVMATTLLRLDGVNMAKDIQ